MSRKILASSLLGCLILHVLPGAVVQAREVGGENFAELRNFIAPDPLRGDDGLPPSPAAPPRYGPINLGLDVDGNAIEGTITVEIAFYEGKYYLYAPSSACGSFDYAPGANTTATLATEPRSFYRYCGLTIYESSDMMRWKLIDRLFPQHPETGRIYPIKKARVLYSAKTGLYTMWLANGQGGRYGGIYTATSRTPVGPWSLPKPIENPFDPEGKDPITDFDLGTGPDGRNWLAASHGRIRVFELSEDNSALVKQFVAKVPPGILNGGIGIHYEKGWWYVTGGPSCANCVATSFAYIMARDPSGPWLSPATLAPDDIVQPAVISQDSGNAQSSGSLQLPDGRGGSRTIIPFKHYRATAAKAPTMDPQQPADANLALAGLWWYPLEYDASGRIKPIVVMPSYRFPLATNVRAAAPPAYQADLSITAKRSVVQSWTVPKGQVVASLLPAVFQRTLDDRPAVYFTKPFTDLEEVKRWREQQRREGKVVRPQEPMMDAPLIATLTLPDGKTQSWSIDPRTISWSPRQIPLNLARPYAGGGKFTLRLTTAGRAGGYGVAVGPPIAGATFAHVESGVSRTFPVAMAFVTRSSPAVPPVITAQPRSVRVTEGDEAGFVVEARGDGLGYQWKRDGKIILAPDGKNESTAANLRLDRVSQADAGAYAVEVMNQVGLVTSEPVHLEVVPASASRKDP